MSCRKWRKIYVRKFPISVRTMRACATCIMTYPLSPPPPSSWGLKPPHSGWIWTKIQGFFYPRLPFPSPQPSVKDYCISLRRERPSAVLFYPALCCRRDILAERLKADFLSSVSTGLGGGCAPDIASWGHRGPHYLCPGLLTGWRILWQQEALYLLPTLREWLTGLPRMEKQAIEQRALTISAKEWVVYGDCSYSIRENQRKREIKKTLEASMNLRLTSKTTFAKKPSFN